MNKAQRQQLEAILSEQWELDAQSDDFTRTVELILRRYGPEILGYLVAVAKNEERAWDAFSLFSENLWRTMGSFQRRSSFRTWAYLLTRQALYQVQTTPAYRDAGNVDIDDCLTNISKLAMEVRLSSMIHLKQTSQQLQKLRDSLSDDEQTLMILRLEREMSWPDIAEIMGGDANPAQLRQRFKRLKTHLKELARKQGLLS